MMTAEEFQADYHRFCTTSQEDALSALRQVDCEEPVVVVRLGAEYCLMLRRAARAVLAMGMAAELVEMPE